MKLFHQTGHFYKWNVDSLFEDNAGDGLILSPVNLEYSKLTGLDSNIKSRSFFDPQLYLVKESKGKLDSYPYFPANLVKGFDTFDFDATKAEIAKACIDLQVENEFLYITIPTRYESIDSSDFYDKFHSHLIQPFLEYHHNLNCKKKLLLTFIVNEAKLLDDEFREFCLTWITSLTGIDGLYLIFDIESNSKQIKKADVLADALYFIDILIRNDLEVHIGYANTEALLYSLAFPTSVSMGSYENLRKFKIQRFESTERGQPRGPNARLFSNVLLQWIEYTYLGALRKQYHGFAELFSDSRYSPLMFKPEYKWYFTKPELYKHFFIDFSNLVGELPDGYEVRKNFLIEKIDRAIQIFSEIEEAGVFLDQNSDGGHLYHWKTAIHGYEKLLRERG